jgi:hypothetical protein
MTFLKRLFKKAPPVITGQDAIDNVVRARLGDQNAQGWLQELGERARKGEGWARGPYNAALAYMTENPPDSPDIGAESGGALSDLMMPLDPDALLAVLCFLPHSGDSGVLEAAVVALSHGPEVSTGRMGALQAKVPPPALPAFRQGLAFAGEDDVADQMEKCDPETLSYLGAGHCLGMARRIQQVRAGAPFDTLSADVGWELDSPDNAEGRVHFNK